MRKPHRVASTIAAAFTAVAVSSVTMTGTASAAPAPRPADVWDKVAQCESGGRWNINTGNGYQGGLQFHPRTWRAYGGTGSAAKASKAEQKRVARNVLRGQGPGAWPVCSRKAGLTKSNDGAGIAGAKKAVTKTIPRRTRD